MKPTTRKIDVKQTMADLRSRIQMLEDVLKNKSHTITELNNYIGHLLEKSGKNK